MRAPREEFQLPVQHRRRSDPAGPLAERTRRRGMVGAEGFEPSNTGSKVPRLTTWPRPIKRRPVPHEAPVLTTANPLFYPARFGPSRPARQPSPRDPAVALEPRRRGTSAAPHGADLCGCSRRSAAQTAGPPTAAWQPVAKVPAAFERRCIPPDCVVRRLHMPNMRPPHALSGGRLAALGATRGFTTGCLRLRTTLQASARFYGAEQDSRPPTPPVTPRIAVRVGPGPAFA